MFTVNKVKNKNWTIIWFSNPAFGYYLKDMKSVSQRNLWTPMLISALLTISDIWKQHKCSLTDEWVKEMWYTHTHTMKYKK